LKTIVVIPARHNSTRFPGKPLVKLLGKTMIERVAELSAKAVGNENVYIATENNEILNKVKDAGFKAILTSNNCLTGTDRVAEVAKKIDADIYVNVQGDEPLINPNDIKRIIEAKKKYPNNVLNAYTSIEKDEKPNNYNIPKVIFTKDERLIYISRKDLPGFKEEKNRPNSYYKQVCIYAFNREELEMFSSYGGKSKLEMSEDIEILRFLEMKKTIQLLRTSSSSLAVDEPSDVKKVELALKNLL
jgi:3-deoxy-manno-octulosonate cytidylyltransferase (CMP-KDO synthetase)